MFILGVIEGAFFDGRLLLPRGDAEEQSRHPARIKEGDQIVKDEKEEGKQAQKPHRGSVARKKQIHKTSDTLI